MGIKEYFTFSKRERTGIIGLLVIMLLIVVLTRIFPAKSSPSQLSQITFADTTPAPRAVVHELPRDTLKSYYRKYVLPPKKQFKPPTPIDINTADTASLIALPGIGSKLANRIITFRDKLGGFYDVRQVSEVYGLQDSVFRKLLPLLRCNVNGIRKININAAEQEELKTHPYIRWNIANLLVTFRKEHGSFSSVEDLSRLEALDADAITRIIPYITFN